MACGSREALRAGADIDWVPVVSGIVKGLVKLWRKRRDDGEGHFADPARVPRPGGV